MTTPALNSLPTTDRTPTVNRSALRYALRHPLVIGQAVTLGLYVGLAVAYGFTPSVFTIGFWLVVTAATVHALRGTEADRQRWAARDIERDLAAERRDQEDAVISASRARPEYRETFTHTPQAQAILDQRGAAADEALEAERTARRARLRAAGQLGA